MNAINSIFLNKGSPGRPTSTKTGATVSTEVDTYKPFPASKKFFREELHGQEFSNSKVYEKNSHGNVIPAENHEEKICELLDISKKELENPFLAALVAGRTPLMVHLELLSGKVKQPPLTEKVKTTSFIEKVKTTSRTLVNGKAKVLPLDHFIKKVETLPAVEKAAEQKQVATLQSTKMPQAQKIEGRVDALRDMAGKVDLLFKKQINNPGNLSQEELEDDFVLITNLQQEIKIAYEQVVEIGNALFGKAPSPNGNGIYELVEGSNSIALQQFESQPGHTQAMLELDQQLKALWDGIIEIGEAISLGEKPDPEEEALIQKLFNRLNFVLGLLMATPISPLVWPVIVITRLIAFWLDLGMESSREQWERKFAVQKTIKEDILGSLLTSSGGEGSDMMTSKAISAQTKTLSNLAISAGEVLSRQVEKTEQLEQTVLEQHEAMRKLEEKAAQSSLQLQRMETMMQTMMQMMQSQNSNSNSNSNSNQLPA